MTDEQDSTSNDSYNIVTDTVVGPNFRWKDNLYQLSFILVCVAVGIVGGLFYFETLYVGILGGMVIGMIVGTLISGMFLMIYRGIRHLCGRHD